MNDIFPLTITQDRYGGCYSGGKYTAWNKEPCEIPLEIFEGDIDCCKFWFNNKEIVGIGDTPDLAIQNLKRKLWN